MFPVSSRKLQIFSHWLDILLTQYEELACTVLAAASEANLTMISKKVTKFPIFWVEEKQTLVNSRILIQTCCMNSSHYGAAQHL